MDAPESLQHARVQLEGVHDGGDPRRQLLDTGYFAATSGQRFQPSRLIDGLHTISYPRTQAGDFGDARVRGPQQAILMFVRLNEQRPRRAGHASRLRAIALGTGTQGQGPLHVCAEEGSSPGFIASWLAAVDHQVTAPRIRFPVRAITRTPADGHLAWSPVITLTARKRKAPPLVLVVVNHLSSRTYYR
jgi:hypothetical protein